MDKTIAKNFGPMRLIWQMAAELRSGGRKSWEDVAGSVEVKEKSSGDGKNKPDLQWIIITPAAMLRRLSDPNSLESKDGSSTDGNHKSNSHEECPTLNKLSPLAAEITIYDKKWTDGCTIKLER